MLHRERDESGDGEQRSLAGMGFVVVYQMVIRSKLSTRVWPLSVAAVRGAG